MKEDLSTEFVVYGDSGLQMFIWLSPFIERAGYKHRTRPHDAETKTIGATHITIEKEQ